MIPGLANVVIGTFDLIMNYWPKLQDTTKNKIIASIFGQNSKKL